MTPIFRAAGRASDECIEPTSRTAGSPSPLNGERAGVRGEAVREMRFSPKSRLSTEVRGRILGLVLFCAFLWQSLFAAEHHTILTIKPDGSSVLKTDKTEPRLMVEQQVRMWERFESQRDNTDEDVKPPKPAEVKPFSDDELAKQIRHTSELQAEQAGEDSSQKIETLEIKTNTVRTVTTRDFASLEEMLRYPDSIWAEAGLAFENMKFENGADAHLRVTLIPVASAQRYAKAMRQQWTLTAANNEVRLVFPGKVLSSGLPQTEGNATWLIIDSQKSDTIDAAMKLYDAPTIITAELGGLKIDQPLESKKLQRFAGRGNGTPDLPITDAGPGFAVEPVAVTTTTLYYFPDGEKNLQQHVGSFGRGQTGTVIHAKFFAPKGRTLQSVAGVRVLKAIDDKGRAVGGSGDDEGEGPETFAYQNRGAQAGNSTQISLQLQLPPPDAQSIDSLFGEAIAVTAGKWKEMTLTNVTSQTTNELDLSQVLPRAKMAITKFTSKNRQLSILIRITGPPMIRQLELSTPTQRNQGSSSTAYERNFITRAGQSTLTLQLQQFGVGDQDGENNNAPLTLIVRYPEDQRRERVKFALKGLDLF